MSELADLLALARVTHPEWWRAWDWLEEHAKRLADPDFSEHIHSQDRRDMLRGQDLTGEEQGHRHRWDSWHPDEPTGPASDGHTHLVTIGLVTGPMLRQPDRTSGNRDE